MLNFFRFINVINNWFYLLLFLIFKKLLRLNVTDQEPAKKLNIEFLTSEFKQEMNEDLIQIITKYNGEISSSKFPQYIKEELCKKYGTGWNVFSGSQFFGVCQYEEGYFVKVKLGVNVMVAFRQQSIN